MFLRYFVYLINVNNQSFMNKYPLILTLFALMSCKEISFKEPQPKSKKLLNTIPSELQGSYLLTDDNGSSKDTLVITSQGYHTGHNPNDEAILSDSLILKFYKGYYFVNMNENPEWLLRVLKKEKNGDLIYMSMEEDNKNFNDYLNKLSREIKIDSLVVLGEKLYEIDPSPKKLIRLIEEGYFKKNILKKM